MIREARPDEAGALAAIQRDASLAALADIFPPELYPYPLEDVTGAGRSRSQTAAHRACRRGDGMAAGVAGCRTRMARRPLRPAPVVGPRRGQGPARRGARPATRRRLRALSTSGCSSTTAAQAVSTSGSAGSRMAPRASSRSRRTRSTSATRSRSKRRTGSVARSRARPPRRSRTGSARCVGRAASR